MSSTYFLRALTLTVLSFAAGFVVIGAAQVVSITVSLSSSSDGPATAISAIGMLAGCGIAVGGLIGAIGLYQTGVAVETRDRSGGGVGSSGSPAPKRDSRQVAAPTFAEIRAEIGSPRPSASKTIENAPREMWAVSDPGADQEELVLDSRDERRDSQEDPTVPRDDPTSREE